jgi:hypothetical protein
VRYSPWTYPVQRYFGFVLDDDLISVEMSGLTVLLLYLSRGRVASACFPYRLTPDELRRTISNLRKAGHGLERWIVPGLEFTTLGRTLREDNPATYAVIPELLDACRDLPVAEQWRRVRANAFAKDERARAERDAEKTSAAKPAEDLNPNRKSGPVARKRRRGAPS